MNDSGGPDDLDRPGIPGGPGIPAPGNYGITISGRASVTGSALAAGHGAHAELHAAPYADAVQRQLDEIRALLESASADELTEQQRTDIEDAADAAEDALDSTRTGGRLSVLTTRLQALAACLTGAGTLAQAAEQLRTTIAGLTG
jgi:hypothetical protein